MELLYSGDDEIIGFFKREAKRGIREVYYDLILYSSRVRAWS